MSGSLMVSASQVNLWRECERKWGWRYIEGIKDPPGAPQMLGDEIEREQLQPYLTTGRALEMGRPTRSGEIAAVLLPHLPPPQTPGMVLQHHFVIPSPTWIDGKHSGLYFQGYKDLQLPNAALVPGFPLAGTVADVPFVGDFKSKGNLDYALSKPQLAKDVQANLYAFEEMYRTRAPGVDLAWFNCRTKDEPKAKVVRLRVLAEDVAKEFQSINETGLDILRARAPGVTVKSLQPNPDMCRAYNGCPYASRCNLSPDEIRQAYDVKARRAFGFDDEAMTMSNTSSALANLRARKAAAAGGAPVAHVPAPTPPVAEVPKGEALPVWASAPVDPGPGSAFDAALEAGKVVGINPPEKDLPPAPPVGVANAEPKKRGRPAKAADANTPVANVDVKALAAAIVDEIAARLGAA